MIEYIKGDVIQAFKTLNNTVLLHQENCISLAKLGFAKALYYYYPEANPNKVMVQYFGEYRRTLCNNGNTIYNLYSQYYPGNCNNKLGKYDGFEIADNFNNRKKALQKCLNKIGNVLDEDTVILMPLIASGLAKDISKDYISDLDYFQKYIAPVIEECLEDFTVKVYYL